MNIIQSHTRSITQKQNQFDPKVQTQSKKLAITDCRKG